jgi:hypothetical protein
VPAERALELPSGVGELGVDVLLGLVRDPARVAFGGHDTHHVYDVALCIPLDKAAEDVEGRAVQHDLPADIVQVCCLLFWLWIV